MIVYDNDKQYSIILQKTGSVLPDCLPVGLFSFSIGLTLALLRKFDKLENLWSDDFIANSFSIQACAIGIGYLLVVRTNMALGRWMDGISEIQLMLSKWADAFDALNGFFAGRGATATPEQRERIMNFRIRIAHWFSLMSCLAFAALRNDGILETLNDVPIKELFPEWGESHNTKSFRSTVIPARSSRSKRQSSASQMSMVSVTATFTRKLQEFAGKLAHRDEGLMDDLELLVISLPTPEEICLLDMSNDKVNAICLWIVQGIILEIRAGTLDTPSPIVSRVFQELSSGMEGYCQAYKFAVVPFPFPFAQMVSLLLVILYVGLPFYIDMFTRHVVLTPIISFLIPLFYCGLNQIAIELEEPFGIDDNDVDIEVRHEEFLWLLVDVLRQPDASPVSITHEVETKILKGCVCGIASDFLSKEVLAYKKGGVWCEDGDALALSDCSGSEADD